MRRTIGWLVLITLMTPQAASPSYEFEESKIPKKPSPPPILSQRQILKIPHCERFFLYLGNRFECDSNTSNDAEKLRTILQDVPSALAELETYQLNLRRIRVSGYLGTLSIISVLAGWALNGGVLDQRGSVTTGGYFILGGLILGANSALYSFSMLAANERHLGRAVNLYNEARPGSPIHLQFSTQVNF